MTDKRFHNGIELKKNLLWFKNIDHIPHITDIVLGYNTILEENKQLKQDKKRLIGYLHRYGKVDVEDIDEVVLNQEYLDGWGELYGGDVE